MQTPASPTGDASGSRPVSPGSPTSPRACSRSGARWRTQARLHVLPLPDGDFKEIEEVPEKAVAEEHQPPSRQRTAGSRGGRQRGHAQARQESKGVAREQTKSTRRRTEISTGAPRDRVAGWNSLLGEIRESSIRVRAARGSEGSAGGPAGAGGGATVDASASLLSQSADTAALLQQTQSNAASDADASLWRSYSIGETLVPNSALEDMWRKANDPKCRDATMPALDKVPRLTVTMHKVEHFPPVHSLQHWREQSRLRREQRKTLHEEPPDLQKMMRSIFGCEMPPKASTRAFAFEKHGPLEPTPEPEAMEERGDLLQSLWAPVDPVQLEGELQEEMRRQWAKEAYADAAQVSDEYGDPFTGSRAKGRRNAVDLGQPTDGRGMVSLERRSGGTAKKSRLRKKLDVARRASGEEQYQMIQEVGAASSQVDSKCKSKVERMHNRFLRKKLLLSEQLERRVRRLQLDYEDVQDARTTTIMSSSFLPESSAAGFRGSQQPQQTARTRSSDTSAPTTCATGVLQFLSRHRHAAERERRTQQEVYLFQVEQFQSFLRLMADPVRPPERGEVYISECFRHVLAAGYIIDDAYFFRVLGLLEQEDFERTATVNLVAACCAAFGADLQRYWSLLEEKEVPMMVPFGCPDKVKNWEDWEPWNGVELKPALAEGSLSATFAMGARGDELPDLEKDPLPFRPIVKQETPASSQASRSDPLSQILASMTVDSVLSSYPQLNRRSALWRPPRVPEGDEEATDSECQDEEGTEFGRHTSSGGFSNFSGGYSRSSTFAGASAALPRATLREKVAKRESAQPEPPLRERLPPLPWPRRSADPHSAREPRRPDDPPFSHQTCQGTAPGLASEHATESRQPRLWASGGASARLAAAQAAQATLSQSLSAR